MRVQLISAYLLKLPQETLSMEHYGQIPSKMRRNEDYEMK